MTGWEESLRRVKFGPSGLVLLPAGSCLVGAVCGSPDAPSLPGTTWQERIKILEMTKKRGKGVTHYK